MQTTHGPHAVTAPGGKMPIWVMDKGDFSANFALLATRAERRACLRVAGGCSGMGADDKVAMMAFFVEALSGYGGMIWSGATRQIGPDGEVDPMVTEVPGAVAAANPGCVALGTAPRTGGFHLTGGSRLELDEGGTLVNPNLAGVMVVQDGADGTLGWDGDLDAYFSVMQRLKAYGGFGAVGLVAWNGGAVTEAEILRSMRLGWPTILVRGSGRKTDEIAALFEAAEPGLMASLPAGHRVSLADRRDPSTLRAALLDAGFLDS